MIPFNSIIMKKTIKLISLARAMILMFSLSGCYYDLGLEETVPIDVQITFQNDIIPIFNANCSVAGCHVSGGISPDLTSDKAYNSLISGGLINTNVPGNSELYMWVSGQKSTPMPVGGVDNTIKATILAWIEQGALNN